MLYRRRKVAAAPEGATPLPERLPERLIELEIAFNEAPSLRVLNQLISLYSFAIEHFEAIQNPVYLQYQERLRATLKRRDVMTLLNQSAPNSPVRSPKGSDMEDGEEILVFKPRERPKRLAPGVQGLTFSDAREIDTLLQSTLSESNLTVTKIQTDLKAQNLAVYGRLHIRKMKFTSPKNRSQTIFTRFQFPAESDVGGGISYEMELEKILEKYIKLKAERRAQIHSQYDAQIKELSDSSTNAIVNKVISEMQKALEADLLQVEAEVERAKRVEVETLRMRFKQAM